MERAYAQALFDLSQKPGANATALVERLVMQLKTTGREKLLPRIGRELRRISARADSFGEQLEVADRSELKKAEQEAKDLGITAHAQINETLITGWRARTGSRVIDRSGKRALIELYQQITRA